MGVTTRRRTSRLLERVCGAGALAVLACSTVGTRAGAPPAAETFGCESNPTGDPIGGGSGYREILVRGDFEARTAPELIGALGRATAGQVILVSGDVAIDLEGHANLAIPGGVTLAGLRGRNGAPGARIFNRQRVSFTQFRTAGDRVRLTGLRLEGPYGGRERIATGASLIITQHHRLEVDNCEVYNWNYAAICGRAGAADLRVHHCHIHHCQLGGLGYGISLDQCDARILANRLDWCRHHIAGTGSPGCAYEAAYNLVLPNASSHCFDMHGGRDRGDRTDIAGDWIDIHHNTFQTDTRAVGIRGVPSQGARIHHNWFAAPPDDTVFTRGNTRVWRNIWGKAKTLVE